METRNTRCDACGQLVPPTKFCGECGTTLATPEVPTTIVLDETVDAGSGGAGAPGDTERPRRRAVVVAIIAAVVVVGALVWYFVLRDDDADADALVVEGTFTLVDTDEFLFMDEGDACSGSGGYDDVRVGAQIRVRDGEGRSLANTDLGEGEIYYSGMCQFTWSVEVPRSEFYRFEMGKRGEIEYTFDEMVENGWQVELSLGSVGD